MTNPWAAPDRTAAGTSVLSGPLSPFGEPPATPRTPRERIWPAVRVALAVAAGGLLLAAPAGLAWAALAPQAPVSVVGPDEAFFSMQTREDVIGADGTFVILTLVAGALCGLLAWRLASRWAAVVLVALVLSGGAASAVSAEVGNRVGRADFDRAVQVGTPGSLEQNVRLRSEPALVAWPLAAVLGFLAPYAWRREP